MNAVYLFESQLKYSHVPTTINKHTVLYKHLNTTNNT